MQCDAVGAQLRYGEEGRDYGAGVLVVDENLPWVGVFVVAVAVAGLVVAAGVWVGGCSAVVAAVVVGGREGEHARYGGELRGFEVGCRGSLRRHGCEGHGGGLEDLLLDEVRGLGRERRSITMSIDR